MVLPIHDIMLRLLPLLGVIGNLIARKTCFMQKVLHQLIHIRRLVLIRQLQPAAGAAACGFDGGARRTAAESVQEYVKQAGQLTPENWRTSSLYTVEELDASLQLEEFMFMGLRRSAGAQLAEARTRFGVDVLQRFGKDLQRFIDGGFVEYDAQSEVLRLTERGMAVGNQIFDVFVIN